MNFIIRVYRRFDTICSFVGPSLATYSTNRQDLVIMNFIQVGENVHHGKQAIRKNLDKKFYQYLTHSTFGIHSLLFPLNNTPYLCDQSFRGIPIKRRSSNHIYVNFRNYCQTFFRKNTMSLERKKH